MKNLLIFSNILFYLNSYAQDLINPYLDYSDSLYSNIKYDVPTFFYNFNDNYYAGAYSGEYEILLDNYPWGNEELIEELNGVKTFDLANFGLSYKIELVSFPFSLDCAFPSSLDSDGGCLGIMDRTFNVPPLSYFNPDEPQYWSYPLGNETTENKLVNFTSRKQFVRDQFLTRAISDPFFQNALVSVAYSGQSGPAIPHSVLPHSILKHTINIHCGPIVKNDLIISSFSFLIDLTRGRMREYPFGNSSTPPNTKYWDLLIRPDLVPPYSSNYSESESSNCYYSRYLLNSMCGPNPNSEGLNINYTPFDPVADDNCQFITNQNAAYGDYFCTIRSGNSNTSNMHRLPLADYSINASTSVRNYTGQTLAGYEYSPGQTIMQKIQNNPIVHEYNIDKNVRLEFINQAEKIIYNPSEVNITASDLHFPSNYTFKTIRGVFPYASEVDTAANDTLNGGPFTDPTKRDVPVETDLYKDFHVGSQYPSNDHRYASIYHLLSGSKLTIEPCVKIFDATFEINPGSEIVFQDWSTNQINVQRYQLLFKGGIVTKRDQSFLFQNENDTNKALNWEGGDYIAAGANVDVNKTVGEYTIETNAHVTFEATNYVDLKSGFYAKGESEFEASIKPVIIPPCGPMRIRNPRNNNSAGFNSTSDIGYFTVSPNPAIDNSYFMFEVFGKSNARIIIYDSMGKIIQQIGENSLLPSGKYSFKFQSENLSPGIYFAELLTMDSQKSIKFIKQ